MADKSTIQWHKFFDPSTKYKGQVSSVDPLVVPPGGYQVAKNVRGQNGVPTTRGHITALTPSGLVTGTYKGHSVVFLNDVEYMVVAIRESSTTKVYIASNTGASPTFTEITGTAGAYPDTRFALDGNVCFSVVRNPLNSGDAFAGYDMLVFSNGAETMLYNPFGSTCLPIVAPYAPGDSVIKQSVGFPYYLNMSVANVTVTASDADVTVADNQAHPTTSGTTPYASFGTAVETDGTDWAKFAFASGADVCAGKDLVFVYDTVDFADPWSCLKVQVSADDSTYYTVYTPGTDPLPPVVDCSKSFLQVAFKLDPTVISVGLDILYIKLTWVAAHAPAAAASIYLMAVLGGGFMRGDWTLGASYGNYIWHGQGYVAEDRLGRNIKMMGCQDARNDVQVAVSSLMHYAYYLDFKAPTQASLNIGSPFLAIFGTQSDTADLVYLQAVTLASYSGGWNSTYTVESNQTATVNVEVPLSTKRMPDGLNEVIPPCTSMTTASGRLFCGMAQSYGMARGSDVMFSDQDCPFNFRGIVSIRSDGTVDERSGGTLSLGGSGVKGFGRLSNPSQDSDTVAVFSEYGVWVAGGRNVTALTRPIRVSNYGTRSPLSIVSYKNAVFWLDNDHEVRMLSDGAPKPLSRYKVDDVFSAIPVSRIANVSCHARSDRLYVAFTPSGGSTNTQVGVYDMIEETWSFDDPTYTTTFGGLFTFNNGLRYWTEAGALALHEQTTGSQDNGASDITVTLKTAEYAPGGMLNDSQFLMPWIYAQSDTNHTMTLTLNFRRKGTTSSGTCSLTSSDAYVKKATPLTVGGEDDAASLTVSGPMSAGKRIVAAGMGCIPIPSNDPFTRD